MDDDLKFPKGWIRYKIAEIGEVIGGGTPPTAVVEYYGGNIPWITPKDLSGYYKRSIEMGARNISKEGLANSSARLLPKGTVLFTSRAPIGYVAIASNEITTNQGFKSIVCNGKAHNLFVYYWLKQNKEMIESFASGSTFKEISGSTLKEIEIVLPPISEQRAIAKILSDLDAKIELNRQMNVTLEEMAEALFKRWFVDFEFPDKKEGPYRSSGGKMVKSEFGEIPEGWRVISLSDVCEVVDCLHTKKPDPAKNDKFLLQVYNIGELSTLDLKDKYYVSDKDYAEWTKNIEICAGDCIITNAGKVGAVARVPPGFVGGIGRNITGIRPRDIWSVYLFRYLLSSYGQNQILNNTDQGTIFNSLNVRGIKKMKLLLPERNLLEQYCCISEKLRIQVETNIQQNENLSLLRDSLLPKLMSGKIRISGEVNQYGRR